MDFDLHRSGVLCNRLSLPPEIRICWCNSNVGWIFFNKSHYICIMKKYNLFLDDVRMPYDCSTYMYPIEFRQLYRNLEWVIVRNYKEFISYIQENGLPELVSFDHDLAEIHYDPSTWKESFVYEEETGYDCAKWIVNYCIDNNLKLPEYICHSMNPHGRENILKYLRNFKKTQNK